MASTKERRPLPGEVWRDGVRLTCRNGHVLTPDTLLIENGKLGPREVCRECRRNASRKGGRTAAVERALQAGAPAPAPRGRRRKPFFTCFTHNPELLAQFQAELGAAMDRTRSMLTPPSRRRGGRLPTARPHTRILPREA